MIPEGWRELQLKEVIKLASGDSRPRDVTDLPEEHTRHPVYGGNGILGFSSEVNSNADDIIIGRVGEYCGVTRFVSGPKWITDNALYVKAVEASFDRRFLALKMQHYDLSRLRAKGGQPLVSQKPIYALRFTVPSESEQRAITFAIDTWDRAIETVEALTANARTRKQALMQQLLPQGATPPRKRLPGFSGEWREALFGDIFDLKIGGTPARKTPHFWDGKKVTQNLWVSISDLQGKHIRKTQEHISDEGVQKSNVKALPAGTVIMSFKLSIGRKAILGKPAYTNEAICALIPKRPAELSSQFVFHALELVNFTASTDQAVKGQTLNKTKIADLSLRFPPKPEQDRLVGIIENADGEIENLQSQLAALRREKAALMQQLLTGKRRVAVAENADA